MIAEVVCQNCGNTFAGLDVLADHVYAEHPDAQQVSIRLKHWDPDRESIARPLAKSTSSAV